MFIRAPGSLARNSSKASTYPLLCFRGFSGLLFPHQTQCFLNQKHLILVSCDHNISGRWEFFLLLLNIYKKKIPHFLLLVFLVRNSKWSLQISKVPSSFLLLVTICYVWSQWAQFSIQPFQLKHLIMFINQETILHLLWRSHATQCG